VTSVAKRNIDKVVHPTDIATKLNFIVRAPSGEKRIRIRSASTAHLTFGGRYSSNTQGQGVCSVACGSKLMFACVSAPFT